MFVFKGKELLYARKDEGTGDHAPLDDVLNICCKVPVTYPGIRADSFPIVTQITWAFFISDLLFAALLQKGKWESTCNMHIVFIHSLFGINRSLSLFTSWAWFYMFCRFPACQLLHNNLIISYFCTVGKHFRCLWFPNFQDCLLQVSSLSICTCEILLCQASCILYVEMFGLLWYLDGYRLWIVHCKYPSWWFTW